MIGVEAAINDAKPRVRGLVGESMRIPSDRGLAVLYPDKYRRTWGSDMVVRVADNVNAGCSGI
jgi:hypothetical protein